MIKTHLVRVLFRRTYSKRPRFNNLDDLLKRKTLDDVDPEVIRELINRRTNELNIQQELKLLKQLTQAEKDSQKTSLSKYSKILWIAAIGGSLAFLVNNLMTWKSRYDMREQELAVQMAGFEHELGELLKAKERALEAEKKRGDESPTEIVQTKWYQNWLWR